MSLNGGRAPPIGLLSSGNPRAKLMQGMLYIITARAVAKSES